VVQATRVAYLAKLHPDKAPHHLKKQAEERFKEVNQIFDRISQLKG
jgi:DnaJ-class molecular chaperone